MAHDDRGTTLGKMCASFGRASASNFLHPTSRASRDTSHGSRSGACVMVFLSPPRLKGYTLRKPQYSAAFGRKSFRIRSYEECACNSFRIHSYKNIGLKVPVESYSYKKHRGEGGGLSGLRSPVTNHQSRISHQSRDTDHGTRATQLSFRVSTFTKTVTQ
jgi:hypothetical protein